MEIQWSLVLFTAISGLGSWLFGCLGLSALLKKPVKSVVPLCVAAIVLLAVGGIASVTHLSHPDRMLNALSHPTSGIFVEAVLLGINAVVVFVYALLYKRESAQAVQKVLAVVGIAWAFLFTFECGNSYIMSAQTTWGTIALPLGYMGTAASAGCALWAVLCAFVKQEQETCKLSKQLLLGASILALVTVAAYGLTSGCLSDSTNMMIWVATLVLAGVVPAVLSGVAIKKSEMVSALNVVAFVSAFAGSITFRCLMWVASVALMSLFGVVIE